MRSGVQQVDKSKKLEVLRADYLAKLPKKLLLVNEVWQKLTFFSWNDNAFASLYRLVHGLSGSGKMFGHESLSHASKDLEDYLLPLVDKNRTPTEKERRHIESLIERIVVSASLPAAPIMALPEFLSVGPQQTVSGDKTIFIVDDDSSISLYLSTLLGNAGYLTRSFANPALATEYIANCVPDAVIMDIMFPSGSIAGYDAVNDIRTAAGKRVPFIFISARTDLTARTQVVRAGGDAYFTKPLNVSALMEKINDLLQRKEQYKVLIVDDEAELSQFHALMLDDAGIKTSIVNKPIKTLQSMEAFTPDLVLMDMYMPDINGMELASVIRQDEKYLGLPIVFLSAEGRKEFQDQAFGLGANDFLTKPVSRDKLVETVNKQIQLARQTRDSVRKVSQRDTVAGLYNRQYFLERLDTKISTAVDALEQPSLLAIGVDNFELHKDKIGFEWLASFNDQIAALIVSQLKKSDMATQFSDGYFLVLAAARDEGKIIELVKSIRAAVDEHKIRVGNYSLSLTCSVGVVKINPNILNINILLAHAERTLTKAQEKGCDSYVLDEILPADQVHHKALMERIENAIARKSFQLVYQPIISVEHSGYEMYEALIRIVDEEGKVILPSQFIPLARQTSDIITIDRWVIEHAIQSLSTDSHSRTATDFFIKISGKTLHESMLIPWISNSLTEGGISGESRVIFHINENDLITNLKQAKYFADNVKKLKCGVSIDHFGVTQNSVQLLTELKPDYVELRSSVLHGFLGDGELQGKVQKLVEHALAANIKTIASNIEDPSTLSLLWNMGVRYFQGFFIQEPRHSLSYNFYDSIF